MNSRKWYTPGQVVRRLGRADWVFADGGDVVGVCCELGVSEQRYYPVAESVWWSQG